MTRPSVIPPNLKDVTFTEKQYLWLQRQFPELVLGPDTPEPELRHYMGQRSVIVSVQSRIQR